MDRKACHNCHKRRLRCDRSIPVCNKCTSTGQECLGYGKLFRWTNSVAVRGKMAGKPAFHTPEAETHQELHGSLVVTGQHGRPPVPLSLQATTLIDPLLQDLDLSSRRYLSYCKSASLSESLRSSLPTLHSRQTVLPRPGRPSYVTARHQPLPAACSHVWNAFFSS